MWISIIAPLCYALLFIAIIWKFRFFQLEGIGKVWPEIAFALKLAAGFFFWMVYTYYYTNPSESDAFRYFSDSLLIKNQWFENKDVFWSFMLGKTADHPEYAKIYDQLIAWNSAYSYGLSNDCSTIIRLNVLVSFVSFDSFHVHAIIMSFFSFVGFTALFKAFRQFFIGKEMWLFVACFLLPSVVFWSSTLLKEAPLFLFLGLLFWSLTNLLEQRKVIKFLLLFAVSFILLIYIKEYVLIAFIPGLLFLCLIKITGQKFLVWKFIALHVLCFMVAQNAHYFFRGGDFIYVLHKKQVDFYNVAFLTQAGSTIEIPNIASPSSFLIHYPQAFFLTYFRPFITEAHSAVNFVFALENLGYLLLFISTIVYFKRPKIEMRPMLFALISFMLVLATIIGNCVPILGAVVRYKVPALPFFAIVCFSVMDFERIQKSIIRLCGIFGWKPNVRTPLPEQ